MVPGGMFGIGNASGLLKSGIRALPAVGRDPGLPYYTEEGR